ncbi:MAG TPA: DUF2167 domain-containing protein [Burkholderiales bacterium]|nr:DUF2167 domain-containing protein [Burkholderiales bacterium]
MAIRPYISSMRASLLIAAAILVHIPAWAQDLAKDRKAEAQAAVAAAQKAQVLGPADIKLADQAVLKLPQGYTYIPAAEGSRLMTVMGNRVGDGMLGLVFPDSDRKWFVVMHFAKSGYIKDDDAKDWKADELLKGLKEGTEEANKDRRERGIREIEVLGWVEPPTYDAATHRLIWSLSSKQKGDAEGAERGINYNTYALGREGYISMNLVTGMGSIQTDKSNAHLLLAALGYNEGKRYTDFNSATDHIAEFGLAALIGGVAAKKLGLFALIAAFLVKFAKVILIAGIALIGVLAKIFRGRKQPGDAPPPQT